MNIKKAIALADLVIADAKLELIKTAEKVGLISKRTAMKMVLKTGVSIVFDAEEVLEHDVFMDTVANKLNEFSKTIGS